MRFLLLVIFIPFFLFSQSPEIDSLRKELTKTKNDTMRILIKSQIGTSEGVFRIGFWDTLLKESAHLKFKSMMGSAYNNLGFIYNMKGDVLKALKNFSESLKIQEEMNDPFGISAAMENIGGIYLAQGDFEKALENYNKCLEIRKKMKDDEELSYSYNSLGYLYDKKGEPAKAIEYYRLSLDLRMKMGDSAGISITINNIGSAYEKLGELHLAKDYYMRAQKIMESVGDMNELTILYNNLSRMYLFQKDYNRAESYALKSYNMAQKAELPGSIAFSANSLFKLYKTTGRYKEALEYFELSVRMRDSLNNENTRKASVRSQLKYEYEKQAAADSVAHAKETEIKNAELKKQQAEIQVKRNQQFALVGGLGLVLVFAGFMFNRWKVTQKQKVIIEHQKVEVEEQKELVEEKQKEILDSIKYAQRIQRAHLPNEKYLSKYLSR